MQFTLANVLGYAAAVGALAIPAQQVKRGSEISITPHDSFSSSIGVLGCHINTNRVAYFPTTIGCSNMCIKVSANGRSVNLLKVDQSGGAYDMSYDAWNYLNVGEGAHEKPTAGGGIPATYEEVDMSECRDLITSHDHKLPFAAANGMNFVGACLADPWFSKHYTLYNIANSCCTLGYDEVCSLNLPDPQAKCPHQLGSINKLTLAHPVTNIVYPTGEYAVALQ